MGRQMIGRRPYLSERAPAKMTHKVEGTERIKWSKADTSLLATCCSLGCLCLQEVECFSHLNRRVELRMLRSAQVGAHSAVERQHHVAKLKAVGVEVKQRAPMATFTFHSMRFCSTSAPRMTPSAAR